MSKSKELYTTLRGIEFDKNAGDKTPLHLLDHVQNKPKMRYDDFIISFKDYEKLDLLVNELDGDMQQKFNKILHNLEHPVILSKPETVCPPDKIMVNRVEYEDLVYDLCKFKKEEMEQ